MYQVHTAVLIGRFQPFHNGHLALLEQALQVAQQVIVVLGSAHQARSPKNPWVWEERRKMIDDCLPTRMKGRVQFVPIRDYYDLPQWVAEVQRWVEALVPPMGVSMGLISHEKDASSAYLRHFPKWKAIELPRQGAVDATPLRELLWNLDEQPAEQVQAALAAALPEPVLQALTTWRETPAYAAVREEAQAMAAYRAGGGPVCAGVCHRGCPGGVRQACAAGAARSQPRQRPAGPARWFFRAERYPAGLGPARTAGRNWPGPERRGLASGLARRARF